MTLRAKGIAQGFTIKKPGTYTVKIPQEFFFTAIDQDGNVIAGQRLPVLARGRCTGEAGLDQGHQVVDVARTQTAVRRRVGPRSPGAVRWSVR